MILTMYSQQIEELTKMLYPREDLTERIIGAKQFIDRHYANNLDLGAICTEAYISKYHFIRLFKRYYGCTPHQYLTEVRVKKAKILIQNGMTVRGACFSVGYNSVTSFSSLFKKMNGTAPSRIE